MFATLVSDARRRRMQEYINAFFFTFVNAFVCVCGLRGGERGDPNNPSVYKHCKL